EVRRYDLECDDAIETRITGAVDLAHAADTQRAEDFVRSKPRARSDWHLTTRADYIAALSGRCVSSRGRPERRGELERLRAVVRLDPDFTFYTGVPRHERPDRPRRT